MSYCPTCIMELIAADDDYRDLWCHLMSMQRALQRGVEGRRRTALDIEQLDALDEHLEYIRGLYSPQEDFDAWYAANEDKDGGGLERACQVSDAFKKWQPGMAFEAKVAALQGFLRDFRAGTTTGEIVEAIGVLDTVLECAISSIQSAVMSRCE